LMGFIFPLLSFPSITMAGNQVPVAQTCNSTFLGGWDWEYGGLRPFQCKTLAKPISSNSWVKWCYHLNRRGRLRW
jgi:hypothetical protein